MKLAPSLILKAIEWSEAQYSKIQLTGQPLNETLLAIAKSVGVLHPEHIRLAEVQSLPLPEDPELRQTAIDNELLDSSKQGLTFGYGVYICQGHTTIKLLSHEFRHVYQYEQSGSIAAFLNTYLQQIDTVGYEKAPFELDAKAHEIPNGSINSDWLTPRAISAVLRSAVGRLVRQHHSGIASRLSRKR